MAAARIPLDGPIPRPPLYGLTSVATEVTQDIRGGAVIVPYPAALPNALDPCSEGTETKDIPDSLVIPDGFPVFDAYLGEVCTAYNIGDWGEWQSRANVALAARTTWALERQLVNAQFQATMGNADVPYLGDAELDVVVGGAVPARVALAYLDGAIASTGIEGIIHITPEVATYVGWEALRDDRGTLRTASGTRVVVGQGYSSASLDTLDFPGAAPPDGEAAAAAGQSWIYATGPVLYQQGAIFAGPPDLGEALDRDTNEVIYRAERPLWVGWDAQLQAAVLADWSP